MPCPLQSEAQAPRSHAPKLDKLVHKATVGTLMGFMQTVHMADVGRHTITGRQ